MQIFRGNPRPPKPAPAYRIFWICSCGSRNYEHRQICGGCGNAKPAPAPPAVEKK